VRDGVVTPVVLDPSELGLERSPVEALRGGDPAFNAQVARDTFGGVAGPVRDAVVLNAGMALAVADWPDGVEVTREALTVAVRRGIDRAEAAVDTGAATALLDRWVEVTRALSAG
jgi:anthranilate phosphoribosyltransferase